MSILIPGMRLPKMPEKMEQGQAVPYIDVRVFADGDAVISTGVRPYYKKYQAIELPPHGRLIDADALKIYQMEENVRADGDPNEYEYDAGLIDGLHMAAKDVSVAPTVIPADPMLNCYERKEANDG